MIETYDFIIMYSYILCTNNKVKMIIFSEKKLKINQN